MYLTEQKLLKLIDLARIDVVNRHQERLSTQRDMYTLYENQMRLHATLCQHLVSMHQISLAPVLVLPVPENNALGLHLVVKCEDEFSKGILEHIEDKAAYFSCLGDFNLDYPQHLVDVVTKMLKLRTETLTFNGLDMRFANLSVLSELLYKDKHEYEYKSFNIQIEKTMNGSTPYYKIKAKYTNPYFKGHDFEIEKSVYSYNFFYKYLDHEVRGSHSYNANNGDTELFDLPEGLSEALDNAVAHMYYEFAGETSEDTLLKTKLEQVSEHLRVTIGSAKDLFTIDPSMTDEDKITSVRYFIAEHLQSYWSRALKMSNQTVACIQSDEIALSDDKTAIVLWTKVNSFFKNGNSYTKREMFFTTDSKGDMSLLDRFKDEDGHTKLFAYWILTAFEKDLRNIRESMSHTERLGRLGRNY